MVQRIIGLASGMDIDSMVKQLMTAERVPLDKMKQKKQILEWQRDDYRTLNSLLLDFQNNTLFNMKLSTQFRVRNVVSSNDNYVTASASGSASLSSTTIQNVSKLATAATKINSGSISGTSKIDITKSLETQNFAGGEIDWQVGSVKSQSITAKATNTAKIDLKGETLNLDPKYMNIEVNGKRYDVITSGASDLTDNNVLVDSEGNLTFKNNLTAGNVIKVDYTTTENITKQTVKKDATEMQLNLGSNSLVSIKIGSTVYKLSGNALIDENDDTNILGGIDNTGKITFSAPLEEDTTFEIHSTEKYAAFNIQTFTTNNQQQSKTFLFRGSDSLNNVINQVNNSKVGVTMFYDSFKDQVTMTRTETGDFNTDTSGPSNGSEIITDNSVFLKNILKFDENSQEIGGTNATFTINGLETQRNSNTFTINGVTYTLKQVFNVPDPNNSGGVLNPVNPVTLSISNDIDTVFNNIKSFVDKYNTLIDTINKKLTEERYRDYQPLTDDQREQLSDKQQEQWEEKAKSGLLKGDSILSSALTQMRTLLYQPIQNSSVSSKYSQLAQIGITTSPNFLDGGKLVIDEAKLKKALTDDPSSVEKMFTATGDSTSSQGLAQRLSKAVSTVMNQVKDKAGSATSTNKQFSIGKSLDNLATQILDFNNRLTQIENRYYSQFTAMEKAIQQANSQGTYVQQMFSSGR
ncbi:flagellar filament capping protein FliD [Bacillus sp. FJAT-49736]|uniref:flagellar filament capping protein FliD n=1 Tax=Bacillus sp. FJAT-49736 TaxID=2833582 RepID=UPI001BC9174D|nr:flagellar filament capping protein FliD [Bacillus sp. FJAT-49736]MBS4174147.1 flagellar filament capping protein FliD [Bacillus sp. FJAT-49736]